MGAITTKFQKIKEEELRIRKEVKKHTITYLLAAFSFVVGLAWNDAIKTLIEYFYPPNQSNIFAKLIYAFVITFIVVVATVYFFQSTEKEVEK